MARRYPLSVCTLISIGVALLCNPTIAWADSPDVDLDLGALHRGGCGGPLAFHEHQPPTSMVDGRRLPRPSGDGLMEGGHELRRVGRMHDGRKLPAGLYYLGVSSGVARTHTGFVLVQ